MNLRTKIPLAAAGSMLLVFAVGMAGVLGLKWEFKTYEASNQVITTNEREVGARLSTFKTQVHEWKNVLLRGKDPELLDKSRAAFQKEEEEVGTLAKELHGQLVTRGQGFARKVLPGSRQDGRGLSQGL